MLLDWKTTFTFTIYIQKLMSVVLFLKCLAVLITFHNVGSIIHYIYIVTCKMIRRKLGKMEKANQYWSK